MRGHHERKEVLAHFGFLLGHLGLWLGARGKKERSTATPRSSVLQAPDLALIPTP